MTHYNHRQGTYRNFSNDFSVLAFSKKPEVALEKRKQCANICLYHDPGHASPRRWEHYVFDSKEKVTDRLSLRN